MPNRILRVSIVLPVYNEADRITDCLRAIARQTVKPYEVIVVDNNSTDATARLAASFSFVRVIQESRQGVVYARDTGFDAARGDIIGRLDGDSRLDPTWVAHVTALFQTQPDIQAVSGAISYYDIACRPLVDSVDGMIRGWLARRLGPATYLLGANMAIRKSAWDRVRTDTCIEHGIHEDLDLAAHMSLRREAVAYEPALQAGVSGRRADTGLIDFLRYLASMPRSYARHQLWQRLYFYPVLVLVAIGYLFLRIVYRGFDQQTGTFQLRKVFGIQPLPRPNPTL